MNKARFRVQDVTRKAKAWVTRSPFSCVVFHSSFLLVAFILILLAFSSAAHAQVFGVPKPTILIEKKGRCVADTDIMRREHMNLLKHQRDKTVREGVRTTQYSLNGCIECHASSQNHSVIGTKDNFCESCHAYVAIKLDCFECHASRPMNAPSAQRDDRGELPVTRSTGTP
jgi:[DsrC]-trisulfide reductase subunit J